MDNLFGNGEAILLFLGDGYDSHIEFDQNEDPDQNSYFEHNEGD